MKKYLLLEPHLYILIPLILFLVVPLTFQISFPKEFWILEAHQLFLYLGIFYINYYVIVPKTFFKGRNFLFVTMLFLVIIFASTLNYHVSIFYNADVEMSKMHTDNSHKNSEDFLTYNGFMFLVVSLVLIFISTTIKVNRRLKYISSNKKKLEQEKLSSELAFLKAQINPHFFFNVLHAIYALTEINVEKAQEALHSLSLMMRYVIYEAKHHTSLLSKELQFIEHYIKLMKLRIPQNTNVIFNRPQSIQDYAVSSMILLPFIENAFKHGVTYNKEDEIIINISQESNILSFEVINPIAETTPKDPEESTGIGLTNTKRRLDLLYPNLYQLHIEKNTEKKEFRIILKLHL